MKSKKEETIENEDSTKRKYDYARVDFRQNGKKYTIRGKTVAEANKKAALKKIALEKGVQIKNGNMLVRDWAHEWLETYKKGNVIDKVYQDYEHRINDLRFFQNLVYKCKSRRLTNKCSYR